MNEIVVTIIGNIASDVIERRTMDGAAVANFGVVSSERRFDKESGTWVDGHKLFAWVSCWKKLAGGVVGSLKKGDPVIVNGRLFEEAFEKEGEKRSTIKIEAYAVGPNLGRCTAEVRRGGIEDIASLLKTVDLNLTEEEKGEPALSVVAG